jgi:hypothetical protein
MRYRVTNKGEARTVDFLAVFAEGETREFTDEELDNFQHLSGVPVYSSILTDTEQFDVVAITEGEKEA